MVCLIVLIVKVNLWSVCQDAEAGAPWIYRTFGWWELLFSPCGFVTKWCDLKVCFSWSPFVLLCCSTWRVAVNPWLDATVTLQKGYLRVFSSSASCVDRNKTFHMKAHPDRRNEEWGERMFLCKQPSLDLLSMENMISWICRGWRGPLRSHSTPSARAGSPEQVVQHSAHTGSEYPQRRAVHHLSAQPVPVLPFIKVSIVKAPCGNLLNFNSSLSEQPVCSQMKFVCSLFCMIIIILTLPIADVMSVSVSIKISGVIVISKTEVTVVCAPANLYLLLWRGKCSPLRTVF